MVSAKVLASGRGQRGLQAWCRCWCLLGMEEPAEEMLPVLPALWAPSMLTLSPLCAEGSFLHDHFGGQELFLLKRTELAYKSPFRPVAETS